MQITPGQKAPEFEVTDVHDKTIRLSNYHGKKVMVAFFRYAACPLCNLRVHQLIQNYDRWKEKGFEIIAFFESPRESIKNYVGKQDAPFPIIPDPKREIYKLYGVESSFMGFVKGAFKLQKAFASAALGFRPGKMEGDIKLLPADFLIGTDGGVVEAFYAKDISEHMPIEKIEKLLAES